MKFDMHVHSVYSKDSFLRPETILKVAKKKGLDGVAITDHGTIKGAVAAQKANNDRTFTVITGAEIRTEYGDVIGIFLQDEIRGRRFADVVEEIKRQGGYSILAHPYRQYDHPETLMSKVDFIEAFNARSKRIHNDLACDLVLKYQKPITAGSDAHLSFEVGGGIVCTDGDLQNCSTGRTVTGKTSNYYIVHGLSVAMEQIKKLVC